MKFLFNVRLSDSISVIACQSVHEINKSIIIFDVLCVTGLKEIQTVSTKKNNGKMLISL